jgi:hypothetical protein
LRVLQIQFSTAEKSDEVFFKWYVTELPTAYPNRVVNDVQRELTLNGSIRHGVLVVSDISTPVWSQFW